jgi:hypothetical protein
MDSRPACVISSGGWATVSENFRGQHKTTELYEQFLAMLEAGRKHKEATGQSLQVSRYAIVPIPEHLRNHVVDGSIETFPVDTAQSMFDFRAEDVVGKISPRPVIFLHSSEDSVTPTEQSIALFDRAGLPKDLHLFAETDHFMFDESNMRVRAVVLSCSDRAKLTCTGASPGLRVISAIKDSRGPAHRACAGYGRSGQAPRRRRGRWCGRRLSAVSQASECPIVGVDARNAEQPEEPAMFAFKVKQTPHGEFAIQGVLIWEQPENKYVFGNLATRWAVMSSLITNMHRRLATRRHVLI